MCLTSYPVFDASIADKSVKWATGLMSIQFPSHKPPSGCRLRIPVASMGLEGLQIPIGFFRVNEVIPSQSYHYHMVAQRSGQPHNGGVILLSDDEDEPA